jgi:hypothetical protein
MKSGHRRLLDWAVSWVLAVLVSALAAHVEVNVTQHHNHDSRDGLYVDPAFTLAAAAQLKRDTNFDGTIVGHVYARRSTSRTVLVAKQWSSR